MWLAHWPIYGRLCIGGVSVSSARPQLARSLGIITAPDDEAAARTKAIEYFHIEEALKFRVVATKLEKVKERA